MFRSPRILSPVPSRAELAGTITTADEISVDCTKYSLLALCYPKYHVFKWASCATCRVPHHSFRRKFRMHSTSTRSLRDRINPSAWTCRNLESLALESLVNSLTVLRSSWSFIMSHSNLLELLTDLSISIYTERIIILHFFSISAAFIKFTTFFFFFKINFTFRNIWYHVSWESRCFVCIFSFFVLSTLTIIV